MQTHEDWADALIGEAEATDVSVLWRFGEYMSIILKPSPESGPGSAEPLEELKSAGSCDGLCFSALFV